MYNIHILLADDDNEDRSFFTEALADVDPAARLTLAKDGEQLMDLLNGMAELPDLLFLDLNMPKKNGFSCLIEIKESSRLAEIPVVILSTSSKEDQKALLLASGAEFYFSKPAEYQMLKDIIEMAISAITKRRMDADPFASNK